MINRISGALFWTAQAKWNGIWHCVNRPNINSFIMFCIPVSMQRAASRSVTWVIWTGDSSMWTQPTFPSNSNWWTQKTERKKHKILKHKQNMQNVVECCMLKHAVVIFMSAHYFLTCEIITYSSIFLYISLFLHRPLSSKKLHHPCLLCKTWA